ncbi:MAG: tetratricopeptide repeat protein [Chthoniobacteraceae bacterium]
MKTVATFSKAEEAHLLRMRLEDGGIEAFVQGENTVQSSNALGGIRVEVADEDVEAVREVLGDEAGVLPGNAGGALPPPLLEGADSLQGKRKSRGLLYVSLVFFLLGVPFLFAVFHFHDFLRYMQNEHGGEDAAAIDADDQMHKAVSAFIDSGIAKRKAGNLDGALADFDSALKLNPDDYYANINHGITEAAKIDFTAAMADYNKAIRLRPDKAPAYVIRGLLKKMGGDLDGAMEDYDKAIALDPNNSGAYLYRGTVKNDKGDTEGALADYDKAVQLKPGFDGAYFDRSRLQLMKGDLGAAMADCNKAIELGPNRGQAYGYRAYIKKKNGDLEGAMADCDRAVQLVPNNRVAYEYRAGIKQAKGDLNGALVDFGKAIELSKNLKGDPYHYRGCLLFDMRRFPEAMADFRKASELGLIHVLDDDYVHYRIYLVHALTNENAAGIEELKAYLSKRKAGPGEDWRLMIGRFLADQMPEADFLNAANDAKAEKSKQKQCEAWFYAGMKHLIAGDKATAQDDFKKCIATDETLYLEYASAQANLKFLEVQ